MAEPRFKRVLLKISGEALMGSLDYGTDADRVEQIAMQIQEVSARGMEMALVVGAGNIYRGLQGAARGMDRATADYMGMLATVLNALTLQDALEKRGAHTRVLSAIQVTEVAEPYIRRRAIRHLEKGRIVIFAAGTGNPFFTTDTAAALRALEIHAEAILMAKHGVEGVYDADPSEVPDAKFLPEITHRQAIERGLRVMDSTALTLCMDNALPIYVFNMADERNIDRIVRGERVGTLVSSDGALGWVGKRGRGPREAMSEFTDDLLADAKERMAKSVEACRHELATVRTGRASPHLLDRVVVDYYGTETPLRQLSQIAATDARLLTLTPYDKNAIKAIEKAILESDLGLTPSNDGNVIRLQIPELNEERRRDLVKVVHNVAEESRIAVRNIRRDVMHDLRELKKEGEVGEDDERRAEAELQKRTDGAIGEIEALLKAKEEEILEV